MTVGELKEMLHEVPNTWTVLVRDGDGYEMECDRWMVQVCQWKSDIASYQGKKMQRSTWRENNAVTIG